jgi:GNAT superfamily N-acetyltransferase
MVIREVRESDASEVASLADQLGYPSGIGHVRERILRIVARSDERAFVAEADDGSVVGWVHVFGAHRLESDSFAEIGGLVVDKARRSKGIGTALLAAAEIWAGERGYSNVRVRSNTIRPEAGRFYEGRGFAPVKSQTVFAKTVTAASRHG